MAATIEVAVLGLGRVGASIGMALKRYNSTKNAAQQFRVTGYDLSEVNASQAKSMGAFDVQSRSIFDAVRDKALVVMALPYGDVQQAYRDIGGAVTRGTVIMDLSPYKAPSLQWAKKSLPDEVFVVGVTPILNPAYLFDGLDDTTHAAADLLDKGALLIMPAVDTAPEAVELISDLGSLIDTTIRFADPVEHDGWAAATEGLPAVAGIAAFYMLMRNGSWRDAQQQGNPNFGRLVHALYDTHADDLRDLLLNNREGTVRQIDGLIEALHGLRDTLARNDRDALEAILGETTDAAHLWVIKRRENKWDKPTTPKIDSTQIATSIFFGSALGKRLRGDRNNDRK
ncbi:MAG: prephenate dehydrogenase/arogenate dehydrogenase family protein [Anaerolineae bacterium]